MTSSSLPPRIGEPAPQFTRLNQDGQEINFSNYKGKYVVIYFYPKALTPGCTVQACGIRDEWQRLRELDAVIFGISPDKPKLLKKFKDTEALPFDLLSDEDHAMALAYDVWKEKSMYGRTYMGMMRDTYVLGPDGTIIDVLHKVTPSQHAEQLISIIIKHRSQSAM